MSIDRSARSQEDGLRTRRSAVRGAKGYSRRAVGCSTQNAPPVLVARRSRQLVLDQAEQLWTTEQTASTENPEMFRSFSSNARNPICSAPLLSTVRSANVGFLEEGELPPQACVSRARTRAYGQAVGGRGLVRCRWADSGPSLRVAAGGPSSTKGGWSNIARQVGFVRWLSLFVCDRPNVAMCDVRCASPLSGACRLPPYVLYTHGKVVAA